MDTCTKMEVDSAMSTTAPAMSTAETQSDSGEPMDTGTISKLSKSHPESERGPWRKQKNLDRAKKHRQKLGLPWVEPEQLRLDAAALALPGVDHDIAVSMHDLILEQRQNEPNPEGEEKRMMIEDALVKEIPEVQSRWVKMKDGDPYCFLGKKVATEGHLGSKEHLKRMEEDAIGTLLTGLAQSTRRFEPDMCKGVLTKKMMYTFWGDALENLPKKAMEIHMEKGSFFDGKKLIQARDSRVKYELGVVSYPGTGKYKDATIYVPWHDLPDAEEVADEEQLQITSPPGHSWWPVIALQTEAVSQFMKKIFVVCFYQLLADGRVIGWWIYIAVHDTAY